MTDILAGTIYADSINAEEADENFRTLMELDWETRESTPRDEYFMAHEVGYEYTYGEGRGVRTYVSRPFESPVSEILGSLNRSFGTTYNVCFLNRYVDQRKWLGWHSDDSPGMDLDHPIAVISFGAERYINWRPIGESGPVPDDQKQLLKHGSLFIMPAGFQRTHEHKIPKHSAACEPRISLTFRHFIP